MWAMSAAKRRAPHWWRSVDDTHNDRLGPVTFTQELPEAAQIQPSISADYLLAALLYLQENRRLLISDANV